MNCDYPNCKNHKTCNLKEDITSEQMKLNNEIQYWLIEFKKAKTRIQQYGTMVDDITKYHKYSTPVNVYGHIEYAPKKNIFGVFIRRPEHVIYGWNINNLEKNVECITDKIRELRMKELRC